jgi:hypothetical protein
VTESISDRIDRFHSYFQSQISTINQLESPEYLFHYKRILFISILEALSKVLFPRMRPRNRMVNFICEFSGWEEADRVSLPHLVKLMSLSPEPQFEPLRSHANELFRTWNTGDVIGLDRDPSYEDIQRLWPKSQELRAPIHGVTLESLQHVHLFYSHRNCLVHEFRMPGLLSAAPAWATDTPHYSVLELNEGEDLDDYLISWELQYPVGFYVTIANTSLEALRKYLCRNSLDPISFFESGSYWLEGMN